VVLPSALFTKIGVSNKGLGWFPLGFELVKEDEPFELLGV
jgi:hypothetical protein